MTIENLEILHQEYFPIFVSPDFCNGTGYIGDEASILCRIYGIFYICLNANDLQRFLLILSIYSC
jgi:hypothetical protein